MGKDYQQISHSAWYIVHGWRAWVVLVRGGGGAEWVKAKECASVTPVLPSRLLLSSLVLRRQWTHHVESGRCCVSGLTPFETNSWSERFLVFSWIVFIISSLFLKMLQRFHQNKKGVSWRLENLFWINQFTTRNALPGNNYTFISNYFDSLTRVIS